MKILNVKIALSVLFLVTRAEASTLVVGPGELYPLPSAAAEVAADGDTILIAAGKYTDCAVWLANNLTITGAGSNKTEIGNKDCWGKGVFVVYGNDVTIRGLALVNASVPDQNGAGIRAEGTNLLVQHVQFKHDQDGILADSISNSVITVEYSSFYDDGYCGNISCSHGIYVGEIAKLSVNHSSFLDTQIGHDIKSRAAVTEITYSKIQDGPNGTSSYLIDVPNGGIVTIRNNMLEKGPLSTNHTTAISIGEEGGLYLDSTIDVDNNTFQNDCCFTYLVDNYTPFSASLIGNILSGGSTVPLLGPGVVH